MFNEKPEKLYKIISFRSHKTENALSLFHYKSQYSADGMYLHMVSYFRFHLF